MPGRLIAGRRRAKPYGFATEPRGVENFLPRELGIVERHDSDSHQPRIAMAEVTHCTIVRACSAIFQFRILLAAELRLREGREHQLAFETEIVERLAPITFVERTERGPTLRAA